MKKLNITLKPQIFQDPEAEILRLTSDLKQHTVLSRRMDRLITCDQHMVEQKRKANLASQTRYPVLIEGPTGTGKELLALICHGNKPNTTFFAQNCAGIPTELLESTLFGTKRGSFTGAYADKDGLLVEAGDGTVFLDEIADLSMHHQAKLLRVLQENRVRPVGSNDEIDIHCRFVFATHKDLRRQVAQGFFREDLYFRIAVLRMRTTSLAERPGDVSAIVAALCEQEDMDVADVGTIPTHVFKFGNVRALQSFVIQTKVYGREEALAAFEDSHLP